MSKYYVRQVNPEYQEDPLFSYGDWSISKFSKHSVIYGNNDFRSYTTALFDELINDIPTIQEDIQYNFDEETPPMVAIAMELDALNIKKENGTSWSDCELDKWLDIAHEEYDDETALCVALTLITGNDWNCDSICGCVQSEYNTLYYDDTISKEDRDDIETCYFNTGTEVIIHDQDDIPEEPEDIDGYSEYITDYDVKRGLAEVLGCSEDDIVYYEFSGYTKSPTYSLS